MINIRKNNIDNTLFVQDNLINLDNDDNFDDLYSIIKKINFNSILLNNDSIFAIDNKEYKNYIKIFNRFFNTYKKSNKNIFKHLEKTKSKNFTESTKMNSSSSKKIISLKFNNENNIKEFRLDNNNNKDENIFI